MACDPKTYNNVDQEIFDQLKGRLSSVGITLENDAEGTVKGPMGIVMDYAYNPSTENLAIQIVEKNFLMSCKQIEGILESALKETGWQN